MNMKTFLSITLLAVSLNICAQSADDRKLVEQAINNYVEAFYQADTAKAYESIAKDLAKRGYYTGKDGVVHEAKMSFEQLIRLAKRWKGSQQLTEPLPKKITVFDVMDKIASAKVEAHWGIDLFHLAKIDESWMIINVLWQEYPPKK